MTRCPLCDRPLATPLDWHRVAAGDGSLCWSPPCTGDRVDWRARALAAETRERARCVAILRAIVDPITAQEEDALERGWNRRADAHGLRTLPLWEAIEKIDGGDTQPAPVTDTLAVVPRRDLEHLLVQAFRYALPRTNHLQPYRETFRLWLEYLDVLDVEFLRQAVGDCEAQDRGDAGHMDECGVREGFEARAGFVRALRAEIARREGAGG